MPLDVYYLDDEVELLELFSEFFSTPQVVISTFTDPAEFLAAVARRKPDLVFLGYRLPGNTGDQIGARLDGSIPKALITGEIQVKLSEHFAAQFGKPLPLDEIKRFIDSIESMKHAA